MWDYMDENGGTIFPGERRLLKGGGKENCSHMNLIIMQRLQWLSRLATKSMKFCSAICIP